MRTQDHAHRAGIGAVAGAAAVGLIAGLVAERGRKVVTQAAEGLAGDWVDVLKAEHLMVLELFERLEATANNETGKRTRYLMKIKQALTKHTVQEENVVYPALAKADPSGAAAKLFAEHADVKTALYELDVLAKDDPQWMPKARALRHEIEEHARKEEDEVFPALRNRLSEEDAAKLTALMLKEGTKLA